MVVILGHRTPDGDPYTDLMYPRPHRIWVAGLVRQSAPALAIFPAGSDCGMPYAPEDGLRAFHRQPDSTFHSRWR